MGSNTAHPVSTAARRTLRCSTCGYGAVHRGTPLRCPMCGGTSWNDDRSKPGTSFADLAADIHHADADEPMQREVFARDSWGILPGVPLS